jgi:uncharacterized membrane protein
VISILFHVMVCQKMSQRHRWIGLGSRMSAFLVCPMRIFLLITLKRWTLFLVIAILVRESPTTTWFGFALCICLRKKKTLTPHLIGLVTSAPFHVTASLTITRIRILHGSDIQETRFLMSLILTSRSNDLAPWTRFLVISQTAAAQKMGS